MAQFTFDLVSPEKLVFSGSVTEVVVPGADGDFGVMAGHAPVVASLRPGVLTIRGDGALQQLYVRGGFAEISAGGVTVLAEQALPLAEVDAAAVDADIAAAEAAVGEARDEAARARALDKVGQLKNLRLAIGASKAH